MIMIIVMTIMMVITHPTLFLLTEETVQLFYDTLTSQVHELCCDDLTKFPLEVFVNFVLANGESVVFNDYLVEMGCASYDDKSTVGQVLKCVCVFFFVILIHRISFIANVKTMIPYC